MKEKLFIVVNVDWAFLSHRLQLALSAKDAGYAVTVIAIEERKLGNKIRGYGFEFIALPTTRSGTNIFKELTTILFLYSLYRKRQPDIVHHVTLKPVAYGSVAARLVPKIKVINAITGFGTIFIDRKSNKVEYYLLMLLFKFGFNNANLRFILQNVDDLNFVKSLRLMNENNIFLVQGSGVDLNDYPYSEEPISEKVIFLLPARMLWDKGVGEFEKAARLLYSKYNSSVEFLLAGATDEYNKTVVDEKVLLQWTKEGHVKWIGFQYDMPTLIKNSNVVVLPSYQEGLPKSLIEACAIGRPIISTDVPGCREVVGGGENGILVHVKDVKSLTEAMEIMINNSELRKKMGKAGRRKAEELFSMEKVIGQTLDIYRS